MLEKEHIVKVGKLAKKLAKKEKRDVSMSEIIRRAIEAYE